MRIQHNIAALNTNRNLGFNNTNASKALEKLSSGYKINRAGDDAAGLAISEKMRGQIRGLNMASKNAQDSISLIQTAEEALNEVHTMLQRGRELAVQAANDTNVDSDREAIQKEIDQINEEINRIGSTTEFNTLKLLNGSTAVGTQNPQIRQFLNDLVGHMLETSEDLINTHYGLTVPQGTEIKVFFEEGASTNNAFVRSWYDSTTGVSNRWEMTLNVTNMITNAPNGFEADTTVAHEMVHAMMSASGISWKTGDLPKWFKEGTAEYLSGGNDRVRAYLGTTPTAQNIVNFLGTYITDGSTDDTLSLTGEHYAAGHLATMYIDKVLNDNGNSMKDLMQALTLPANRTLSDGLEAVLGAGNDLNKILTDLKDVTNGGAYLATINYNTVGSIINSNETNNSAIIPDSANQIDPTDHFTYVWDKSTGHSSAVGVTSSIDNLHMQIGANEGQTLRIELPSISSQKLSTSTAIVETRADAEKAITAFDNAIIKVSDARSTLGAIQNRLEHTINNLGNTAENLTAAESRIRDTDMANEMMNFTKQNILMQAAQSMLAQANQQPQGVLQLLG